MSNPINLCPGYNIEYIRNYYGFPYPGQFEKMIPDVKPKKTYFDGWQRYGYEIKPEDLMKHHWDNECFKINKHIEAKIKRDMELRADQRKFLHYFPISSPSVFKLGWIYLF
ncbi:hypothetical protein GLOIN_2v986619 [Rhizophagus clarus]|uniref:Uncharacterized protein n=1 Tax=Rhizophagus clarus TaxID=94130 RepID=A0A8H3KVB1_9GLOM|nr:hypothetical protein GLOIN_2v986619 [Rhizophagus clarus]